MKHAGSTLTATSTLDARTSRLLTRVVYGAAFAIAVVGTANETANFGQVSERVVDSFSLYGGHQNLTSWYQTLALGLSALLWLIWSSAHVTSVWNNLTVGAAVLLYMSIGEHTNFDHEFSMRLLSMAVPREHVHSMSMVAAAAVAGTLFVGLMPTIRKYHSYPQAVAVAFAVYVLGAIGFEVVSNYILVTEGQSIRHVLASSAEELLELVGSMLFAAAMIKQLSVEKQIFLL